MGETNWPNNEAKIVQSAIVGRPERALIDITHTPPTKEGPQAPQKKKKRKEKGNKYTKSNAVTIRFSRAIGPNSRKDLRSTTRYIGLYSPLHAVHPRALLLPPELNP
jgi:hypothetical protein